MPISISPFKNDKIDVTFPVSPSMREPINAKLYKLSETRYLGCKFFNDRKNLPSFRYGNRYPFDIPVKDSFHKVFIFIYPRCLSHNFAKLSFNPSKLDRKGKTVFRKLLINIFGIEIVRKIYFEGRLSRIDIAIDNYDIDGTGYMYMKSASTSIIYREDNKITGQVIGSEKSNISTKLYDKALEQELDLDEEEFDSWHRLEMQVRNIDVSMSELAKKLHNHFNRVCFYDDSFLTDPYFDKAFRYKAREEGLNAAFHKMDRNNRKRYMERLNKHYICYPFELEEMCLDDFMQSIKFLKSSKYQSS